MSDRRTRTRFEIVGRLTGTLAAEPPVIVRNISRGGVLIEAPWSLQANAFCDVCLDSGQQITRVRARVCHVRQAYTGRAFLIGLEFLGAEGHVADDIDRVIGAPPDEQLNG